MEISVSVWSHSGLPGRVTYQTVRLTVMQRTPRTLAAVLALGFTLSAFGASTADIQVTGTIGPSACTPILSVATLHFGTVSTADLHLEQPTALPEHTPTLTIQCGTPTLYGLRLVDNRAGSAHDAGYPGRLGMGYTAAGERIGAYHLEVVPARSTLDGRRVFLSLGDRTGSRWSTSTAQGVALPTNGELLGLVDRVGIDTGAVEAQVAQLGIRAHGVIAPARALTLTDAVPLDGHVTVEVVYL
jgi:hypothetical protein